MLLQKEVIFLSAGNILDSGKTPSQTIIKLAWPSILEQILISLVSYVDTAMVGALGAAATAAVAVNMSTIWLIEGFMTACSIGFMFLVARYIGEGNTEKSKNVVRQSITVSIMLGLFLTVAVQLIANYLPVWLGAKPDVIPAAQNYMKIISAVFLLKTCGVVFSAVIRGAGNTRLPLIINMSANVLNVIGNILLIQPTRTIHIFGNAVTIWGAGMGVEGAAISTAFATGLSGILLFISLFKANIPIRLIEKGVFWPQKETIRNFLAVSIPVALERSSLSIGQIVLTAMVTGLGTASLAAHHLTNTAESIFYLPAYGLGSAATTLVGQALGAKREKDAETFGRLTYQIGFLFMIFASFIMAAFSVPLIKIFTADGEVIEKASMLLRIIAFGEPFFGLFIVISGALRGAGDTMYPFITSIIGMWLIRLGLAFILAYPLGYGIQGAWVAVCIDLILRGILCVRRFRAGNWKSAWKK